MKFKVSPNNTNISSISYLPDQNDAYLKLSSNGNGVDLYGYSSDLYDFQSTVQTLCSVLSVLSLLMMFAGLCIPVGKLIILEALAVVQLTYFSILMFEKIPPTFIGFKALMISNGYNDQNIFFKKNPTSLSVYRLLGLQ